jgi:riboflavin biosynthesis pyrimidine reductase
LHPPLELLFERQGLPSAELPRVLSTAYAGGLGFQTPCVVANFVSSTDGVVAFADVGESGHVVSMDSAPDRFVMGLLRACADVVMVGAGSYRKSPTHRWQAETIYPAYSESFAELRQQLGLAPTPRFVLLSASGLVPSNGPALEGALVVTTPAGAARLANRLPSSAELCVFDLPALRTSDVIARLQSGGARVILTEGGPSVMSQLVAEAALDELFLTVSPALFGRYPGDDRKALTDGLNFGRVPLELLSARRAGSHLFLRYALERKSIPAPSQHETEAGTRPAE